MISGYMGEILKINLSDKKNLRETAKIAKEINAKEVYILPYHKFGVSKYAKLDKKYLLEVFEHPSKKQIIEAKKIMELEGVIVNIGGIV